MPRDADIPSRIQLPDAPAGQQAVLDAGGVACWSEAVTIDTYEVGQPDRYPLFLDRRVYQGSSGRTYPMPMIDSVSHEKKPRQWRAIHLENASVRLMLLPELGGRIHIGYDKVAGYDFFYRNNVIKPALVGLAGPWISGGVEFNWPQHHRPATFLPVDTRIEQEDDGAVVVWHSDLDPLQRMRSVHGVRLRPGSSLIEAEVRLHNRTDVPQTFLWWANVAARAHDEYQSFFPDDVAYVADHARRAITAFPRADRPYYGVDYPALAAENAHADRIDFYANIPVPTSYMITDTEDAFFGGYDHAADAGFVHWADRAVSPGKKQWTWGTGAIGTAWDAQLTDEDGPYVELMAGVYTDNQPDFAWLAPGETKRFSQFWYPIHAIGPARQATTDAAISVSHDGSRVGVIATSRREVAIVARTDEGEAVEWTDTVGPDRPFARVVDSGRIVQVDVVSGERVIASWRERSRLSDEPWVATAPPAPSEIDGTDELYLTATHLEQYRHPTRSAVPYLREALERDPADVRAATALAATHLRHGEYDTAASLLESAIERLTRRNLNPRDGEALYMLALVRERQGATADADSRYSRAAWNAAWAVPANLARARLALRDGRPGDALRLAEDAGSVPEARRLGVLALRALGRSSEADAALAALRATDPLDSATAGLARALGENAPLPADPRTLLDIGAELARAGAYAEALAVTAQPAQRAAPAFGNAEPLRHVLRSQWMQESGAVDAAAGELAALEGLPLDLAFPAGLDQLDALIAAVSRGAGAAVRALLGMWLLDAGRDQDALAELSAATSAGILDPVAWRNLALAIMRTTADASAADAAYAHALSLSADARLVFERDLLARLTGTSAADRLALCEEHSSLLGIRDDLALAHVKLLLDVGRIDEAWEILATRVFRPFEGGEGQVIAAYDRAACARARAFLAVGDGESAIALLRSGVDAPANLGEGRHPAVPLAERMVLLGDALALAGDASGACEAWGRACAPTPLAVAERPAEASDRWIGVAYLRLDDYAAAERVWRRLEARADELGRARDAVDYFTTSLPELLVFDTDTVAARHALATSLRAAAADGRAAQTATERTNE
ncbi:DUF5107 domain-containing protein [Microbacterium lacus]|uniref:DUF5107 domain-containing protein n=1 Tax=Microbacterium lacus TaxID=415217 RepID=UPI00384F166D